jgi:hypothetical protein
MFWCRRGIRALAAAAVLTVALATLAGVAPPKAKALGTYTHYGWVYFYQDSGGGGAKLSVEVLCNEWGTCTGSPDLRKFAPGPCWKNLLGQGGNWNDCISSVSSGTISASLPWPSLCVTVWDDPGPAGWGQTWRIPRGSLLSVRSVSHNDMISSFAISVNC